MIETNNLLSNPTGPEYQFLVGEGEFMDTAPSRPLDVTLNPLYLVGRATQGRANTC